MTKATTPPTHGWRCNKASVALRRRDFLQYALGGAAAVALASVVAACGGSSAPAPTAPASASKTGSTPVVSSVVSSSTPLASATGAAASSANGYPNGGKFSTIEPIAKKGGRIIEVTTTDAVTTSPLTGTDVSGSRTRIAMIFNQLVGTNPDTGFPYPDLAVEVPTKENGGISADGMTYTFKVRQDVRWHDGQPFSAKDVAFTYTTMLNGDLGSRATAALNEHIASVTAPDNGSVVFTLKKVVASFLTSDMYGIAPEHILGNVPISQIKSHPFSTGDPKMTIGTGPFKFQEWVKSDHMTLAKNPAYFRSEPALDQYVFTVVKDGNVVATQLKTGEADYGAITPALFADLSKQPNLNVVKYDSYSISSYDYQLDPSKTTLFQDKRVRQALAYALDREAMAKAILFGFGTVGNGFMPVASWAYAPDQLKISYGYDPKRAGQLLDEAGWLKGADGTRAKDGQRLGFTLWTAAGNSVNEQYATAMQQQWRSIGVDMTPKTEEFTTFVSRVTQTHDYEMSLSQFTWDVDPDQSAMWTTAGYKGGNNFNKYSNPQVDQLFAAAVTELDQTKRRQMYIDVQNILLEDLPRHTLVFPQSTGAVNKRAHNLRPNANNTRWNAQTWWVDDGK